MKIYLLFVLVIITGCSTSKRVESGSRIGFVSPIGAVATKVPLSFNSPLRYNQYPMETYWGPLPDSSSGLHFQTISFETKDTPNYSVEINLYRDPYGEISLVDRLLLMYVEPKGYMIRMYTALYADYEADDRNFMRMLQNYSVTGIDGTVHVISKESLARVQMDLEYPMRLPSDSSFNRRINKKILMSLVEADTSQAAEASLPFYQILEFEAQSPVLENKTKGTDQKDPQISGQTP